MGQSLSPAALALFRRYGKKSNGRDKKALWKFCLSLYSLYILQIIVKTNVSIAVLKRPIKFIVPHFLYKKQKMNLKPSLQPVWKKFLLLTGESRHKSNVEYIGETIKLATKYFTTIGIEIYPLNTDEYAYLHSCGADFVSVYQETYNTDKYEQVHLWGSKRIFPYRFHAQERALLGGMRGVSFGALLGLDDFRKDAFAAGLHAHLIQQKYPHAEISFSTPRLRPYINNADNNPKDVHEKQLLQVMLAYRLLMPYAGITISTRERAGFRDQCDRNGLLRKYLLVLMLVSAAMMRNKKVINNLKFPMNEL